MFRCLDCGQIFETPATDTEFGEAWGARYSSEIECCSKCGGAFEEAERCPICGAYLSEGEEYICGKCFEDTATDITLIARFYLESGEMSILLGELEQCAEIPFETLVYTSMMNIEMQASIKEQLAREWVAYSDNLNEYRKWISDKAKKGDL